MQQFADFCSDSFLFPPETLLCDGVLFATVTGDPSPDKLPDYLHKEVDSNRDHTGDGENGFANSFQLHIS